MNAAQRIAWSVRRIAVILAGVYLLIGLALWSQQKKFIFFPTPQIEATPNAFGAQFEDVHIPVTDGKESGTLDAWWLAGPNPTGKVILYLHGNAVNIGANAEQAARLNRFGYSVLLPDYRGYGKSTGGSPSEHSVYVDAEAAWDYLKNTRRVPPKAVIIYGHSLGGAIAIELAAHHADAGGLMTESTFTSVYDVANRERLFHAFPLRLVITQRFDSIEKIPNIKIPYLAIHGTGDRLIPYQMSQQLYAAARQPKRILLVPRADHDDCALVDPTDYEAAVKWLSGQL